ncbi:MAG: 1-(5-phosphoribosyl)-5-[(5-phosphoribosylamino)methylideneamino]imidazole-4-carboxamide isomerase [Desulfurobacteriaceae bacterium]
MFEVIPAVDIRGGKCVRLYQGRADREKVYFENPVEVALKWCELGASRLHVVDLDGAFEGVPKNIGIVEEIVKSVAVPVQFGGGVRTLKALERLFDVGVDRVVVGTVAVENPELFEEMVSLYPGKIVLGIDAKGGMVTTRGWVEVTALPAVELAGKWQESPIWGFVYTDISRDGTLTSPNFEEVGRFASSVSKPVIASGGVTRVEDLERLSKIKNVVGAIVGRALYEGTVDLREALKRVSGGA